MADLTGILKGPWSPPARRNVDPPEVQLAEAIAAAGYHPPATIYLDGKVHRFSADGKPKNDSGWYVAWGDGTPAGCFGCWKDGTTSKWTADIGRDLTDGEKMVQARRLAEAKRIREDTQNKQHSAVADAAQTIWERAMPASADHPYLAAKGIQPHGTRVTSEGRLAVPLYSPDGELAALQYIGHNGDKLYSSNGKATGARWLIGPEEGSTIYIVEGFATGASVHEETGDPVWLAFTKGGLHQLATDLRQRYGPTADIAIVADNDDSGDGQKYAKAAAEAAHCRVIMPPRVEGYGEKGTDANDYRLSGADLRALLVPPISDWIVSADDFATEPKPIKWLVKRWLQDDAFMMVHGPSGGGKTFIVLDWCMHIAAGMPDWNGHKVKEAGVLYLAGEGHNGLRARIAAWKRHHGMDRLKMWLSKSGCDLNTPDGYKKVADGIRAMPEQPRLIVVDTLHRFLDGDENSAQDAKGMVDACAGLMREFGCSVLLVHHTGASEEAQHRARGSTAWKAAMDIEISVIPKNDSRMVTQKKVKDGEEQEPIYFELQKVELPGWLDEDGEQVSSVVPVPGEAPVVPKKESKLDSFIKWFEGAWWQSGADEEGGSPYVSRSAFMSYLLTQGIVNTEASAKQYAKPSEVNKPIGALVLAEKISVQGHGWAVTDPILASAMLMRKNGGR